MTYEYVCTACAHGWEAEQSISEAPLKTCPSCGQETAKRQISGGAGFILKGGGWYADGYGSAKPGSSSGGTTASSSGSSSGEAKPADAAKPASSDSPAKGESTTKASAGETRAASA